MDVKRIFSALLGFPLIAVLLIFGNKYVVDVACAGFALIALNEFFNCFKGKANPIVEIGYISALAIACIHIVEPKWWLVVLPIIVVLLFLKVIITKMKVNVNDVAITLLGIIYIVGSIIFIPIINGAEHGKLFIWYIFCAAWGTDIFAYIFGITMGKHKFSEISPKKSIEGCVGGVLGAIALMLTYTAVINTNYGLNIDYLFIFIIAIVFSLIGQIGDLAASTVKRYAGVKDFSNLIPGHGGIIDRLDSIMFVAPFVYIFFVLLA